MAKQSTATKTVAEKCDYYKGRINDKTLSEGQRRWAQKRYNDLCAVSKSNSTVSAPSCSTNSSKYTDAQKYAYGAGIGYGAAKSGKRVDVKPENKQSFRDGYSRGQRRKK